MMDKIILSVLAALAAYAWVWGYQHFGGDEARAVYLVTTVITAMASWGRASHKPDSGEL